MMQGPRVGCSLILLAISACGGSTPTPVPPAPASAPAPVAAPTPSTPAAPSAAPAATAEPQPKEPPHWKYSGEEGPTKWGDLWPDWSKCKAGVEQSPVDLPKAGEKSKKPVALATDYHQLPLEILNNGHTVQVPATAGGKIAWEGTDYQLQQFHFHTPSEHSIAGVKFDGELHLVHKNANGELLVLGLLLKSGKENKLLEPVIAAAPEQESHELKAVTGVKVDLSGLVPVKVPYYAYPGSLTTPPCSEGVKWLVVAKPLEISSTQLKKMQSALHGENARPTLPLGARTVVEVHP